MRKRRRPLLLLLPLLGLAAGGSCLSSPTGAGGVDGGPDDAPIEIGVADLRVLFIGNSLTYTNALPGVVAALAEAAGRSFAHATIASPNYSLGEHWAAGVADRIREARADVVVLQQGPSSLPESREHLIYWAGRYAPVIREAGGVPALLMVWPSDDRLEYFDDVRRSYRDAARAVDGTFIPAGQTWLEAWARDESLALYDFDGFHPSYLGTLAAAQTVVAVLLGLPADSLPALDDGVGSETRVLLRQAVGASVAGYAF